MANERGPAGVDQPASLGTPASHPFIFNGRLTGGDIDYCLVPDLQAAGRNTGSKKLGGNALLLRKSAVEQ